MTLEEIAEKICDERYTSREMCLDMVRGIATRAIELSTLPSPTVTTHENRVLELAEHYRREHELFDHDRRTGGHDLHLLLRMKRAKSELLTLIEAGEP